MHRPERCVCCCLTDRIDPKLFVGIHADVTIVRPRRTSPTTRDGVWKEGYGGGWLRVVLCPLHELVATAPNAAAQLLCQRQVSSNTTEVEAEATSARHVRR